MRGRGVLGGREISRQQSRQESRDVPGLGSWWLKQGPGCQPGSWDSLLLLARVRGAQLPLAPPCDAHLGLEQPVSPTLRDGQHTLTPAPSQCPSTLTSSTTKLSSLLSASLP